MNDDRPAAPPEAPEPPPPAPLHSEAVSASAASGRTVADRRAERAPWVRFLLRAALVYFVLYTYPFPLDRLPDPRSLTTTFGVEWEAPEALDSFYAALRDHGADWTAFERRAVDWTAARVLGREDTLDRPMGSGDPTFSYVLLALRTLAALVAALLWTGFARLARGRGRVVERAAPWLHVAGRYYLAFVLFGYGFAKVFPSQFRFPGLGRLVTPYGEGSPMNVLWSFMGSSPAYTVFGGIAEVLPALLLLFRRTSTLGALLAAAVMGNIVALNYCYDVPVKLFSTHLLFLALLLALPDARRVADVFLRNRAAAPRDLSRPRTRWLGHVVRALFVLPYLAVAVTGVVKSWSAPVERPALYGIWDVASFTRAGEELAPRLDDPRRWRALLVERDTFGWLQRMDGSLASVGLRHDAEAGTLDVSTRASWSYELDGDRLVLRGEFARSFRADPRDFQSPAEPRDPQVELRLARAAGGAEEASVEEASVEEATVEGAVGEAAQAPDVPARLVGRWTLVEAETIGDVVTRRRADPVGWTAMTLAADGAATFEFPLGALSFAASATGDGAAGELAVRSSSTFDVARDGDERLTLTGEHRGAPVEVGLNRRDLESFLLVRRGFHWINEIPLNRY